MNPAEAKQAKMLEKLYAATTAGLLSWEYDPLDETVECSISNNRIVIRETINPAGSPLFVIQVHGEDGSLAERFNDEDLSHLDNFDFGSYYQLLTSLFAMAKRSASGADKIIDSIINGLDSLF